MLDFLAIAVADVAAIAERRTDRMLDVARYHGLPPFLADDPGVDSGLMIAQYTQAAIVSELKRLAVPASVDSIPSSAMQEDHVSMGWSAARKLRRARRRAGPGRWRSRCSPPPAALDLRRPAGAGAGDGGACDGRCATGRRARGRTGYLAPGDRRRGGRVASARRGGAPWSPLETQRSDDAAA